MQKAYPGLVARASFLALILVTSFYCLLAYIPFTYLNVVKFPMFHWLSVFERSYPLLYGVTSGAVCLSLRRQLRDLKAKRIIWGFILLNFLLTVVLTVRNVIALLPNDERSLIAGFIAFFPLLWLAAIDFSSIEEKRELPTASVSFSFFTPVSAAAFVCVVYTALSLYSNGLARNTDIRPFALRLAVGNLVLLVFLSVSLKASFDLVRRLSKTIQSLLISFVFLSGILGALMLRRIVLQTLPLNS